MVIKIVFGNNIINLKIFLKELKIKYVPRNVKISSNYSRREVGKTPVHNHSKKSKTKTREHNHPQYRVMFVQEIRNVLKPSLLRHRCYCFQHFFLYLKIS